MEENVRMIFVQVQGTDRLDAISLKHKKIIFMGSTEKVAKSFYLGNNIGNKRTVPVPKKAILQLHL